MRESSDFEEEKNHCLDAVLYVCRMVCFVVYDCLVGIHILRLEYG